MGRASSSLAIGHGVRQAHSTGLEESLFEGETRVWEKPILGVEGH